MNKNLIFFSFHFRCLDDDACEGVHHQTPNNSCRLLYQQESVLQNDRFNYQNVSVTSNLLGEVLMKGLPLEYIYLLPFVVCGLGHCLSIAGQLQLSWVFCPLWIKKVKRKKIWTPWLNLIDIFTVPDDGDFWIPVPGWKTGLPSLHLNLDDATPYVTYGRAVHLTTPVSFWEFPESKLPQIKINTSVWCVTLDPSQL